MNKYVLELVKIGRIKYVFKNYDNLFIDEVLKDIFKLYSKEVRFRTAFF